MGLDRWEQIYRAHPVWAQTDTLKHDLDTGPARADENEEDYFDRLSWLHTQLLDLRENPSPLVSGNALDQLNTTLSQVVASLDSWVAGNGGNLLVAAGAAQTDSVLDALRGWPATKDRYQRGLLRAGAEFQATAAAQLATLQATVTEHIAALAAARADFETQATTLGTDAQTALDSLRTQVDTVEAELTTQTQRLDAALNGLQATFAQAEAERAAAHAAELEKQKDATRAAAEQAKASAGTLLAQMRSDADGQLAQLTQLKTQAEGLVNAIGLTGTATEYGKYAQQERRAANTWRRIAVGAFVAAFVVFLVTLWKSHIDAHTPWQLVVFKLAASVALLGGGAYAGHESGEHRTEERHAKSVQLNLAALDPFIATLDDDQKRAIKEAAARRLFTTTQGDGERSEPAAAGAAGSTA